MENCSPKIRIPGEDTVVLMVAEGVMKSNKHSSLIYTLLPLIHLGLRFLVHVFFFIFGALLGMLACQMSYIGHYSPTGCHDAGEVMYSSVPVVVQQSPKMLKEERK